jgi:TonB-dependent SusC/RagA subfamily outer membrane receptor
MLATAYYFLQVVICSGLMMGYYWLVLRNKRFHQYNRFYLLAITLLAWIVPLVKIQFNHQQVEDDPQVMQLLMLLANNNARLEQTLAAHGIDWKNMAIIGGYCLITAFLLFGMVKALVRIYHLLRTHSCKNVGDVYLILTQAKGTPFSFFRYIFWNDEIDIKSEAGKQIMAHELTHVRQKHSIDKIFIQLVLVAGWFNPFFWLIKREMEMIHEFIADKKAVSNGDTASLAQMLLTAAYPNQNFALTHPFFFSPIKRRLAMLTNNSKPRFSYIRRLVVLPLLAIVIVLFAFRNREQRVNAVISVADVIRNIKEDIVPTRLTLAAPPAVATRLVENGKQTSLTLKAALDELQGTTTGEDTVILNHMVNKPVKAGIQGVLTNVLVFVDGQRTTNQVLQTMDPNTIKDITILKDPKVLSIYGKEGENGVVLINTKTAAGASLKDYSASPGDEVSIVASKSYPGGPGQPTIIASSLPITGTIEGGPFSRTTARALPGSVKNYSFVGVKDTSGSKPQPVFFLDGVKVASASLSTIDPSDISHVSVLKPPYSTNKYGEDGKNGVIDVYTTAGGKTPITTLGNLQSITVTGRLIPVEGRDIKPYPSLKVARVVNIQNLSITNVKPEDNHK